MDELQALKEFRADVAPVGAQDPARERTMAAIRALIEQETAAAQTRRAHAPRPRRRLALPRVSGRRFALAVAVAAAVAVVLAVLPIRQSDHSLVGEALA